MPLSTRQPVQTSPADRRWSSTALQPRTRAHEGLSLWQEMKQTATTLAGTLAVLWAVQLVNIGGWLNGLGLLPRSLSGLVGIVTWPFLHGGWLHLIGNTLGILTIGALVLLRSRRHFWQVAITGTLLGGAGVWLFGREVVHIGASGVIFAWLGYLLTTGFFERRIGAMLLSGVAFLAFGGALWGLLPVMPGVSFEGHLFGFAAGVVAARALAREERGLLPP
jgi:membrane associated rhomboid family serine protease